VISVVTDVSLVTAQLASFSTVLLLWEGNPFDNPYFWAIVGPALAWTLMSTFTLGNSYSSSTRPRPSAAFCQRGTYRYVRHPIYTGLMAVALAFAVASPSLVVAVAYLSVIAITNVRAGIEEQMLMERYPEYVEYRNRTKRYLPYVI
jgi:protein-S-isoprenylcysteine O-methyltransferase Ste14